MQIHVNTDKNIVGREKLIAHVEKVVNHVLGRFSTRITRIEVHLSDENGQKGGEDDKRCAMEARVQGRPPTVVTHHGSNIDQALDGAADKLKRALDKELDKLDDHHRTS